MNLLARWHDGIKNYNHSNSRKDALRFAVRENLELSNHKPYRYWLNHLSAGDIYGRRFALGYIAGLIRDAVKNEDNDLSEVLDAINAQDYRWVRHDFDFAEKLNKIFDVDLISCHDCSSVEYRDDISWANDDYPICDNCRDRSYHWSERRETYVHDDDDEDDDCDPDVIGEYHSSSDNLEHIPSSFDKRKKPIYLGLELEVEVNDSADRTEKAEELLNAIGIHHSEIDNCSHQYALCEHDSSLDHGFEIVTAWTGLDVHAKQLEFFKSRWSSVRSHDTSTCGLHIHICKSDMSLYHASKLVLFITNPENEKLVYTLARRSSDSYAKIYNKKEDMSWLKDANRYERKRDKLQNLNQDRYEALNFQNSNTIEFRLFKGTLKYQTIMACLEFTYASWFFTKDASLNDLSTDKFLEFISAPENKADTVNLRAYLLSKGYRLPITGLIKTNPRYASSFQSEVAEV
jgi:hypothetical protein